MFAYSIKDNFHEKSVSRENLIGERISFILKSLQEGGNVQLSFFLNLCQEILRLFSYGTEMPDSFYDMEDYLQVWANNNLTDGTINHDAACTGFFALTQIYDRKKREENEKKKLESIKHKMISGQAQGEKILKIIADNPGIRHKDLAKKVGISASQLSQFVARNEYYRLFSTMKPGREKNYYIEDNGREVLRAIDEQKVDKVAVTATQPEYFDFGRVYIKPKHVCEPVKGNSYFRLSNEEYNKETDYEACFREATEKKLAPTTNAAYSPPSSVSIPHRFSNINRTNINRRSSACAN